MSVTFIHTGDLHLGMEFKNASFVGDHAKRRRLELWETFEKIIDRAEEKKSDLLLIAGDLFEDEYCTLGDIKRIRDAFSSLSTTKVVISAGNHDFIGKKSLYKVIDWSNNVHIFLNNKPEKLLLDNINTIIYGLSWNKKDEKKALADEISDLDNSKINILLIHGDAYNADSNYLPINRDKIKYFDYAALGHIHKPEFITENIAYCGSPEPLDFGEGGKHGIIEGIIDKEYLETSFIPFNKREFIIKEVQINENMGYRDILDSIVNCDSKLNRDKNLYRVILDGIRDSDVKLNLDDIIEVLRDKFYYIELIDNTKADYDLDRIEKENSNNIIGGFIKEMKQKGIDNPIVKEALYDGLEILLSEKVKK